MIINPRSFNREFKGYKDKHFKQSVKLDNLTLEIKHLWLTARLVRVTKGRHWAKGYKYSLHVSCKLY
jgi:hypothetical protein